MLSCGGLVFITSTRLGSVIGEESSATKIIKGRSKTKRRYVFNFWIGMGLKWFKGCYLPSRIYPWADDLQIVCARFANNLKCKTYIHTPNV